MYEKYQVGDTRDIIVLTSLKPNIKIIVEFTCTKTMFVQKKKRTMFDAKSYKWIAFKNLNMCASAYSKESHELALL